MKVRDVMMKQVPFCGPDTNLAQAVELMWKKPELSNGSRIGKSNYEKG